MASTITTLLTPTRVTLSSTPDNSTRIDLPRNCRKVIIQFITNSGKVAWSGTDNTAIGSAYITASPNNPYVFETQQNGNRKIDETVPKLYLASGTASTVVEILCE